MAYDEALAERIRRLLPGGTALTERRMFGGIAFLVSGNMAIAASGRGGILVRVDPAKVDRLLATSDARPMRMRGKAMRGWLRVDPDGVRTQRQLAKWVEIGTTFASSLPARPPGTRPTSFALRFALKDVRASRRRQHRINCLAQPTASSRPSARPMSLHRIRVQGVEIVSTS